MLMVMEDGPCCMLLPTARRATAPARGEHQLVLELELVVQPFFRGPVEGLVGYVWVMIGVSK